VLAAAGVFAIEKSRRRTRKLQTHRAFIADANAYAAEFRAFDFNDVHAISRALGFFED
jgi:hypothetical protein